jgi:carboxyl-terminal processing protease
MALPALGQSAPPSNAIPKAEDIRLLLDTMDVLRRGSPQTLEWSELTRAAARGVLKELDPDRGELLLEPELLFLRRGPEPGHAGIGAHVRRRDGTLLLLPDTGGGAQLAGVRTGDELRSIGGRPVRSMTTTEATRLLSGPQGSAVTIEVFRPAQGRTLAMNVERREPKAEGPSVKPLDGGAALVRMPALSAGAVQALILQLNEVWRTRRFSGLMLDLRGHAIDGLSPSLALAAAFLPPDAVIAVRTGRQASDEKTFRARRSDYEGGIVRDPMEALPPEVRALPLVILVDGRTAGAAELVAAALQDARRARIIGKPTFGWGAIATITPISQAVGVLHTSGYWMRPSGKPLNQAPIEPDVLVQGDDEADFVRAATAARATPR